MSYARRVDATQPTMVDDLRAAGVSVALLHRVGDGFPDLVCGYAGINLLVEAKSADGKLRATQRDFADNWRGLAPIVAYCADDVIAAFNRIIAARRANRYL